MASDLHAVALQAEKSLEQLATGLAQAGADEGTVQAVSKMAEVTRKIVGVLGQGQGQQPAQAPQQGQPQQPAAPQPQQPQSHTMDSATAALHQEAQARAAQGGH